MPPVERASFNCVNSGAFADQWPLEQLVHWSMPSPAADWTTATVLLAGTPKVVADVVQKVQNGAVRLLQVGYCRRQHMESTN